MNRSGYSDACEGTALNLWRGAVESAIRGARGQRFLCELVAALDAMPTKELAAEALEQDGQYCALGVVGAARGVDMQYIDPTDRATVATALSIAPALAAEVAFENDECTHDNSARWGLMRAWAMSNIKTKGLTT